MTPHRRCTPSQVCFVVDDVAAAADACEKRFGWGPFHRFSARVLDAEYKGWRGVRATDVALGMAGRVQVELIHVHEGRDAIADYQAEYDSGFQHVGVSVRDRDAALRHLEALGATADSLLEYEDLRIAFVDTPTGKAMFELLQPKKKPGEGEAVSRRGRAQRPDCLALDRATVATPDLDAALAFYAAAFGWEGLRPERLTLDVAGRRSTARRVLGRAGALDLELIEPEPGAADPYSLHLARGAHGLVHAGGPATSAVSLGAGLECEWVGTGERFSLHEWAGGPRALQLHHVGV
jgi:catechol 2,3-dioxygenase-like lactoylglutathione lyase family enzyme